MAQSTAIPLPSDTWIMISQTGANIASANWDMTIQVLIKLNA